MTPAEQLAANRPERKQREQAEAEAAVWRCALRAKRVELRLSMDEVAKAVSMSKAGLWGIEKGSDPMLTTAAKIARFFGCSIESLWPELNSEAQP